MNLNLDLYSIEKVQDDFLLLVFKLKLQFRKLNSRRYLIFALRRRLSSALIAMVFISVGLMFFGSRFDYFGIPVFGASNVSSFSWAYAGSYMDGRGQVSHSLGKGTAQLKVNKCSNYSSDKTTIVYLRKSQKASPGYKTCGTVSFYKAGTYSFGNVGKGTYWLHIKGGKANCYKSASGKVQNK